MKLFRIAVLILLIAIPVMVFAIDISANDSARLDIVSRTSFGIDLDNLYRYGFANELTQFDLVFGLAPYQRLGNRLNTTDAVGFIELTLFHLDLIKINRIVGYNPPSGIGTNRYQTGEFIAGIVKGPWLIQLNAAGNEPFASPWNKGMLFINDGFKFSWAYLDSVVDVRRIKAISGLPVITRRGEENMAGAGQTQEHGTMKQYGFDIVGNIADRFGPYMDIQNMNPQMVAFMYNADNFGINLKLGTQFPFDSPGITKINRNGIIAGLDSVFTPMSIPNLKIFASLTGSNAWGNDANPDPVFGGTRFGYNIQLSDEISVEPWMGLDIGTRIKANGGIEKPGYEFSIGATMRWPGQDGWLTDYILNSDGRVFPGMSLGYKIYEDLEKNTGLEHSLKFTLFEPRGDDGVFYVLGSEIIIDVIDITNVTFGVPASTDNPRGGFSVLVTSYFDLEFNLIGRPGALVPWTIIYYDNLPGAEKNAARINDFKIDLGLNLENAIANTVFGIVWNTGSLLHKTSYTNSMLQHQLGYLRFIAEIRL